METKTEALQDNRVKVTVTVDAAEIDNRIKKTYKDFANKYSFPGFRKGKAPRPIIDNALGAEAVRATVSDEVVNDSYPLALDQCNLYPMAKPEFEDTDLVESGKPYSFVFTLEIKPEFELSSYDAVEIELPFESATDAEIEEQIDSLREHYYTFEDASAATKIKEDSFVDLSMKATDDAGNDIDTLTSESRVYGLGTGTLSESFDKEILGMKKGQSKAFTIDVPADSSVLMSQLAGKTDKVTFEVEVKSVKTKILPEVNDEWIKETLGFETEDDLRTRISESILQQKSEALPRMKENACLAILTERLQGDVPQGMVEDSETSLLQDFFQQLQRQNMSFDNYLMQQNLTSDQFKEDVKKQALDMAKQDLALDAWARHFDMQITEDDVTKEFERSGAEDPQKLEEEWRMNGQLYLVRQGLLRSNAMQDIIENAKVTEVDFAALAAGDSKKTAGKSSTKKAAKTAGSEDKSDSAAEKKPAKKSATKKKTATTSKAHDAAASGNKAEAK